MAEPGQVDIDTLNPREIEVGNSYHAYLLAQRRMEGELEFSGKDSPLYHEVDQKMRDVFDKVFGNPQNLEQIDEIIKLPERDIRTSFTGKYQYDSPYLGLFPTIGGEQRDQYLRYFIPRTNEVLLIDIGLHPDRPDPKFFPYADVGGVMPNEEFVGLDAIRTETPPHVQIVKVGENEQYGNLTFDEMSDLVVMASMQLGDKIQTDTEVYDKLMDTVMALRKERAEAKEKVRETNGKHLETRIKALSEAVAKMVRLNSDPFMLRFDKSNLVDELEIDKDDQTRYGEEKYGRNYHLYFSPTDSKLLIAPYTAKKPSGLRGWLLKRASGGRLIPNDVSVDFNKAIEAPDRYWCKAAPVIAEYLMDGIPEKYATRIRGSFGMKG